MLKRWGACGLLALLGLRGGRAQSPQEVREEVLVREVQILVEPPRERAMARAGSEPSGLLVDEDGLPRTVADVDPVSSDHPWEVLVYLDQGFDRTLDAGGARIATAGAFTAFELAAELAALGPVEIVVADPAPRQLLAAATDPRAIRAALEPMIAAGMRAEREDIGVEKRGVRATVTSEQAFAGRRHSDRLLAWLGARGRRVPRLLILATAAPTLSPQGLNLAAGDRTAIPAAGERAWVESTERTARTLAAMGWTVVALAPGDPGGALLELAESGYDRFRREADEARSRDAPAAGLDLIALGRLLAGRTGRPAPRLGDAVDLRRASLRPYAVATGGAVVGPELGDLLTSLQARWLVSYQSPAPRDGQLHVVSVRAVDGRELVAPCCVGSGLEAVTAARLRLLLAGEPPADRVSLPVAARRAARGSEAVRLDLGGLAAGRVDALRVAVAFIGAEGEVVRELHRGRLGVGRAGGADGAPLGWTLAIPASVERLAVTVEDLATGAWLGGVARIEAAAATAPEAG